MVEKKIWCVVSARDNEPRIEECFDNYNDALNYLGRLDFSEFAKREDERTLFNAAYSRKYCIQQCKLNNEKHTKDYTEFQDTTVSAKITFDDESIGDIAIYKEIAGGQKDTLPWLINFRLNLMVWDPEAAMAQLLRHSAFNANEYKLDDNRNFGWKIVKNITCNANYKYVISRHKIIVYQFVHKKGYVMVNEILDNQFEEVLKKLKGNKNENNRN